MSLARTMLQLAPPSYDLLPYCGPVKNQGSLGACTAFAGCGNREYLARRFSNETPSPILSPMFLYYMERQLDGTLDQGDTGSDGRTDCRAMNRFGICLEASDPYSPTDFKTPPTPEQIQGALIYKAGAYHALSNIQDMKLCVASGYPVLIGFAVYSSFESDDVARTGLMPMPASMEQMLGGHEVLVIGYDDAMQCPGTSQGAFKVRNSWGSDWGRDGNFWMPYEYAGNKDLLWDAWIQHLGKPW